MWWFIGGAILIICVSVFVLCLIGSAVDPDPWDLRRPITPAERRESDDILCGPDALRDSQHPS